MSKRIAPNVAAVIATICTVLVGAASDGNAYQVTGRQNQGEQRSGHRITVEASVIHHLACNARGKNGGRFYIYQYTRRAGFRAILPPNWGNALGGRDWPTFEQAASVACGRRH